MAKAHGSMVLRVAFMHSLCLLCPVVNIAGLKRLARAFVLTVLIGLTALAVAWVCVWWVPAYLALMVCIFVIPHGHGKPGHVSVADEGSTVGNWTDPGQGLRVGSVSEAVGNHLASGSISGLTTSAPAIEPGVSHLDLASSGTARVRRTRSRTRKAVQTAASSTPASTAVTWIRVGPGKFVRAEGGGEAVDQTQGRANSIDDHTTIFDFARDSPASLPTDDALVEGDSSPESAVVNSDDQGESGGSDDCVMGSVTEVYGIAPSTFDSIPSDSPLLEDLGADVALAGVILDAIAVQQLTSVMIFRCMVGKRRSQEGANREVDFIGFRDGSPTRSGVEIEHPCDAMFARG